MSAIASLCKLPSVLAFLLVYFFVAGPLVLLVHVSYALGLLDD